jgi:hypothetical protein
MGIHSSTYRRGSGSWIVTARDPDAKPPAATCRCSRSSGRRCAFSPPPRSSTLLKPSMPATGRWYSWAPTAACGSASWPGSAKPGRSAGRGGHRGRDPHRGQRQADRRPTQDARRPPTVELPPFVVHELEAHLASAERPSSHVFTAPGARPLWVPSFRARFWGAGDQGSRPAGPTHPRPSPHRRGAVDRRRCDAQGGRRARGAHLGQLHPGPLRPPDDPRPVAEGRCHPVRD